MFFANLLSVAAFAAVALAAPNVLDARTTTTTTTNQCNTGSEYCCNSVASPSSSAATSAASAIGISLSGVQVPVGLTCTPISVIGVGTGSSCTQSPVCCTGNNFNGVVVVGCTPINVVV